ncbi:MAG: hypothetical protein RR140_02930 [Clostridia bacterium]
MEDFYVEYFPGIEFKNSNMNVYIKDIQDILNDNYSNTYKFLCAVRGVFSCGSHACFNDISYLSCSWVNSEYTVITILQKFFGFSEKYIYRLAQIIDKFIYVYSSRDVATPNEDNKISGALYYKFDFFKNLTISKMQELLPLSNEQIENAFKKDLSFKSTIKQIREYVKALKNGNGGADKVLEDNQQSLDEQEDNLPMQFDPKKEYPFEYFEKLDKNSLINISWDLYQKIKKLQKK